MSNSKRYRILGLMSGTSLDGLDLAICNFVQNKSGWEYEIEKAKTLPYTKKWVEKLKNAESLSARELMRLHAEYGNLLGEIARDFLGETKIDAIASHGHTIFHEPDKGMTFQLGLGANLAVTSNRHVIADFRTTDVALNGNGAPLVPIGDEYLFSNFTACLNIGGFANVSINKNGHRRAFDICPANMLLNKLANKLGKEYDAFGQYAKSGEIDNNVLNQLDNLTYYKQAGSKSLGKEWFDAQVWPLIEQMEPIKALATAVAHIANQTAKALNEVHGEMLCTGGGAFNSFLLEQIQQKTPSLKLIVPSNTIVNYKEALIFAFLGAKFLAKEENVLASGTGSAKNHIGGCFYYSPSMVKN